MKPNRRKLARSSFLAIVTGASALALQACGSGDQEAAGNNSARPAEEPSGGNTDSDSG